MQVETFGVSCNADGTCFYGMQIEALLDRCVRAPAQARRGLCGARRADRRISECAPHVTYAYPNARPIRSIHIRMRPPPRAALRTAYRWTT